MSNVVISVEHLSKVYHLGQIGTGTFTNDLQLWLARMRGKPNPFLRIGETDRGNSDGETVWALKDVSFTVERGEVLGIIGRNGAGKSTLLKILSRVTAPTSGKIRGKGRVASLLEVGTGFHPELTGRENVYLNGAILGMSRTEIDCKFDEIVDFAEVEKFIDTPVKRYSSGMYVRLAFAVAAHLEPEILVVDEVLAVGDVEFQKKCLGKIGDVAKEGRTVLFVSHNMGAVMDLCSRCVVINKGQIHFSGDTSGAVNFYNQLLNLTDKNRISSNTQNLLEDSFDAKIIDLEILDSNNKPKKVICTWDFLRLRVSYKAKKNIRAGSIILEIKDYLNQRLIVLDSGLKIPVTQGENFVDCDIPSLELPAGEYIIGGGMAISNAGWLSRESTIKNITVFAKDVFEIGRPPDNSRMVIALPHKWEKYK